LQKIGIVAVQLHGGRKDKEAGDKKRGVRIFFNYRDITPSLKPGDNVTVVTSRVGAKNVAEKIARSS
jgi:hypothetical protein